jgi:hypothetical protein
MKPFFPLYLNLSLCKDWGAGERNTNNLKNLVVELFMGIVDERLVLSSNDIAIIENFLESGDVTQPMLFRFTNAINRSLGMDMNHCNYATEQLLISLVRSLKFISKGGSTHANNIINCSYIGEWLNWLLNNSNNLNVLVLVCELISWLMISESAVLKLFSMNNTLLMNLAHQLNKTNEKLRESVCRTLANITAYKEGSELILRYSLEAMVQGAY